MWLHMLRGGVQLRALMIKGSDKVSAENLSQAFREFNYLRKKVQEARPLALSLHMGMK